MFWSLEPTNKENKELGYVKRKNPENLTQDEKSIIENQKIETIKNSNFLKNKKETIILAIMNKFLKDLQNDWTNWPWKEYKIKAKNIVNYWLYEKEIKWEIVYVFCPQLDNWNFAKWIIEEEKYNFKLSTILSEYDKLTGETKNEILAQLNILDPHNN